MNNTNQIGQVLDFLPATAVFYGRAGGQNIPSMSLYYDEQTKEPIAVNEDTGVVVALRWPDIYSLVAAMTMGPTVVVH